MSPHRPNFPLCFSLSLVWFGLLVGCQEPPARDAGVNGTALDGLPADGSPVDGGRAAADAPVDAPVSEPPSILDQRAAPHSVGMDSALVARAVEQAASLSRLHNMIVARHGEVVVERHFRGPEPDRPANVKSVSKSLLSAVVGRALEEGYLESVDQPIGAFFPEYIEGADDPRARITLAHLLSMSSGLESTSFGNRYGRWVVSSNWVRYALELPVRHEPGERMEYSTGSTHLASALLTRATERSTLALARELLAQPLGIQLPAWPRDPQGVYFGGNDMLISPRGLLRFGELYRGGGVLDGQQILSREWIEASWERRVRSPRNGDGYGLGWWARTAGPHEVRFAWGYGGQFLFVVPALELTVVFTSDPWGTRERGHNQALHRMVDQLLIPAAERGGALEGP